MKCRLCESDQLKLYYIQGNRGEFRFYKCTVCGLVNYDLSGGLDQGKYAGTYISPFDEQIKMNMDQTRTFRFITSHLKHEGRILDIGCGNGRLLYLFNETGWVVKGVELSPLLAQSVKNTLQIEVDVADFLEYVSGETDSFDVVVLRHVLEHLPDSILALSKINALLKPDGYAVMEFPNIEGMDHRIKRLLQRAGISRKKYRMNYKPGHCNEFSRKSFSYLTKKTGFKIVVWETYSHKPLANFVYNHLKIGSKARTIIKKVEDI